MSNRARSVSCTKLVIASINSEHAVGAPCCVHRLETVALSDGNNVMLRAFGGFFAYLSHVCFIYFRKPRAKYIYKKSYK